MIYIYSVQYMYLCIYCINADKHMNDLLYSVYNTCIYVYTVLMQTNILIGFYSFTFTISVLSSLQELAAIFRGIIPFGSCPSSVCFLCNKKTEEKLHGQNRKFYSLIYYSLVDGVAMGSFLVFFDCNGHMECLHVSGR